MRDGPGIVMFVPIANTPRDYAWGSTGEISVLLGLPASTATEAELWLGAHPGSPSRIEGTDQTLLDVAGDRLPFLLKVLAAGSPLSLQAHPTMAQAAAGFARENAAGIPLDAPERNYKDALHKPELIYALTEDFEALCGFRSAELIHASLGLLLEKAASTGAARGPLQRWLDRLGGDDSLESVFEWLITRGEGVDDLVASVTALADDSTPELKTVALLAEAYPGDPGIVISLMLNRVTLHRGEVLYLPAGNIHAYLRGVGIELMAASDNVLRGGLTPKHIDVPELLSVLDFRPVPVPYLEPERPTPSLTVFRPDVPDFVLDVVAGDARLALAGPAIALCTAGSFSFEGGPTVTRGDSYYIDDVPELVITGSGELFVATSGLSTRSSGQ